MIEINLLPDEIKETRKGQFKFDLDSFELGSLDLKNLKLVIAGGVVGGLISLALIFSLMSCIRNKQVQGWSKKEKITEPERKEAEKIQGEISMLSAKLFTLDQITKRDLLWSDKLDELSGLVLPGIWFNRLYVDSKEKLIITGSVISKKEEAMAIVGKFMKNIKDNKSFFKDFSSIKLESAQIKSGEGREVVDFEIVLYF
ncbi:MAG: hypothetical protein ABIG92_00270 [Candidatus Omnitrophota bacterium]